MSLDFLFEIEQYYPEEIKIKCQRCKHIHPYNSYLENNKSLKLCKNCREYNKQYLKNKIKDNLICYRCRRDKEITDFIQNNKRFKLCHNCRDYNKSYNN